MRRWKRSTGNVERVNAKGYKRKFFGPVGNFFLKGQNHGNRFFSWNSFVYASRSRCGHFFASVEVFQGLEMGELVDGGCVRYVLHSADNSSFYGKFGPDGGLSGCGEQIFDLIFCLWFDTGHRSVGFHVWDNHSGPGVGLRADDRHHIFRRSFGSVVRRTYGPCV